MPPLPPAQGRTPVDHSNTASFKLPTSSTASRQSSRISSPERPSLSTLLRPTTHFVLTEAESKTDSIRHTITSSFSQFRSHDAPQRPHTTFLTSKTSKEVLDKSSFRTNNGHHFTTPVSGNDMKNKNFLSHNAHRTERSSGHDIIPSSMETNSKSAGPRTTTTNDTSFPTPPPNCVPLGNNKHDGMGIGISGLKVWIPNIVGPHHCATSSSSPNPKPTPPPGPQRTNTTSHVPTTTHKSGHNNPDPCDGLPHHKGLSCPTVKNSTTTAVKPTTISTGHQTSATNSKSGESKSTSDRPSGGFPVSSLIPSNACHLIHGSTFVSRLICPQSTTNSGNSTSSTHSSTKLHGPSPSPVPANPCDFHGNTHLHQGHSNLLCGTQTLPSTKTNTETPPIKNTSQTSSHPPGTISASLNPDTPFTIRTGKMSKTSTWTTTSISETSSRSHKPTNSTGKIRPTTSSHLSTFTTHHTRHCSNSCRTTGVPHKQTGSQSPSKATISPWPKTFTFNDSLVYPRVTGATTITVIIVVYILGCVLVLLLLKWRRAQRARQIRQNFGNNRFYESVRGY